MTDNKNIDVTPRSSVIDLLAESYKDRAKVTEAPNKDPLDNAAMDKKLRGLMAAHPGFPVLYTLRPATGAPQDSFSVIEIKQCYYARYMMINDQLAVYIPFALEHAKSIVSGIKELPDDASAADIFDAYNALPWRDGIVVELGAKVKTP